MIYFTDGYGIYPKTRPGYEVAFVFPETAYADEKLPFEAESFPVWAMYLTVKERKD